MLLKSSGGRAWRPCCGERDAQARAASSPYPSAMWNSVMVFESCPAMKFGSAAPL
jgi:hypothetical protein